MIIGGDFNEEPQNKPISDIMESNFIDFYTMVRIQQKTLSSNLIENYPQFTTFKYRDDTAIKRTIDYIFLAENKYFNDKKVIVTEMLDPQDLETENLLNEEMGNPCENHPSDHYSLGYNINL